MSPDTHYSHSSILKSSLTEALNSFTFSLFAISSTSSLKKQHGKKADQIKFKYSDKIRIQQDFQRCESRDVHLLNPNLIASNEKM